MEKVSGTGAMGAAEMGILVTGLLTVQSVDNI